MRRSPSKTWMFSVVFWILCNWLPCLEDWQVSSRYVVQLQQNICHQNEDCGRCTTLKDDNILLKRRASEPDMAMGSVHPWVGLGWVGAGIFAYEMGWVGFSCQKLIILFTTIIIPLRKSLTVIYHHSLQALRFTYYRFLIYVADLNCCCSMLGWVTSDYISRGLGWVCKVMGWVGLGWVTEYRKWPTAMSGPNRPRLVLVGWNRRRQQRDTSRPPCNVSSSINSSNNSDDGLSDPGR